MRVELKKIGKGERPEWLSKDIWKDVVERHIDLDRSSMRYRYEVVLVEAGFFEAEFTGWDGEYLLAVFPADLERPREGDPLAVDGFHARPWAFGSVELQARAYEAGAVDGFKAKMVPFRGAGRYR